MNEIPSERNPPNAFSQEFLSRLRREDDPAGAAEAELAGPWRVLAMTERTHGVFRSWERAEEGDLPRCVFEDPALAELAASLLPVLSREPSFRLTNHATIEGYALEREGQVCGRTRIWDDAFVQAMSLVDRLARSPEALGRLLEVAGPTVLELVGRRLGGSVPLAASPSAEPELDGAEQHGHRDHPT
ncbi:MAG TPA: hypothetical protein PK413_15235 [Thermoanaerobaculia bacterium]|nr:hypothetical protein [Thermoanaerobaculia bacterium]